MKLMQPIDFILNIDKIRKEHFSAKTNIEIIVDYAKFLKLPIEASQFIPIDENGNILLEKEWKQFDGTIAELEAVLLKHKNAKSRIFFKGYEFVQVSESEVTIKHIKKNSLSYIPLIINTYQTIENPCLRHEEELTEYAISKFL